MRVDIKGTELMFPLQLKEYARKKFEQLGRFLKRYEKTAQTTLFLEVARTTRHHKKGQVFYAEATLALPGKILRAEDTNTDLRVALDRVRNIMKREIEKYKEKDTRKH